MSGLTDRYAAYLDRAEAIAGRWLEAIDSKAEPDSADLRTLTAALGALKSAFDLRRKLNVWEENESSPAADRSGEVSEEEIRWLMAAGDKDDEDAVD